MKKKTSLIDRLIPLENRMMKTTLELNQLLWDLDPELANKVINNYLETGILNTNKMENKYYTPNASEFHISFEYEVFDYVKNKWDKITLGVPNHFELDQFNEVIEYPKKSFSKTFRVKCLDKKDIESLGWNFFDDESTGDGNVRWWSGFKKKEYVLKECNAWQDGNVIITKRGSILFQGNIKNKSKLIDVMKMLDIK